MSKFIQFIITLFLCWDAHGFERVATLQFQSQTLAVEKIFDVAQALGDQTTPNKIWSIEFLDRNRILFSKQPDDGIYLLNMTNQSVQKLEFDNSRVFQTQYGGLDDLAVDQNFQSNQTIYFSYAKAMGGNLSTTALARAKINGNKVEEVTDLFVASPAIESGFHYGSRIALQGPHLFFSIGDRLKRNQFDSSADHAVASLSLENHLGKIIRIFKNGSVPSDNPFLTTNGAMPEIYSYGHRNPQGMSIDPRSGNLISSEHGPRGGDEINQIFPAQNYGWPITSIGLDYNTPNRWNGGAELEGSTPPLLAFERSLAPSSLLMVRDSSLSVFRNTFIQGSLARRRLHLTSFDPETLAITCETELLGGLDERVRDVKQGPDGNIYFSSDSGKIYVIKEAQ